ncbi:MAG: hypothetical protein R3C19_03040 [Planctomycetaceae bacterium]
MSLTFEPLLPPIAWVTLAVLAVALWGWYATSRPQSCSRRTWSGILILTAAGIGCVLLVLLNPIWLRPLPPPAGKPLLTILVDESGSMATVDADRQATRFQAAVADVEDVAETLAEKFDVRIHTFAEEIRPVSVEQVSEAEPAGTATDLATALLDSLVGDRPQGQAVLLISDGIHNAGGSVSRTLEAAETAKAWDAPVYTKTLGGNVQVDDLEVRVPRSQELAFVGQSVPISVELKQHGRIGDRVSVTLTDPNGETSTTEAPLKPNGSAQASFLVTPPETGLFQYQVRAETLPGEATPANNATTLQVRVVDEPVRALVLEGKPYWDAKFLLRMLTDDPSLEVDCLVRISSERFLWRKLQLVDSVGERTNTADGQNDEAQVADGDSEVGDQPLKFQRTEDVEFLDDAKSFLRDADKLREYQILLLGREAESYLNEAAVENIRDWIARHGGSLVCYRGSPVAEPDQKLGRLLPVRWAAGRDSSSSESRFRIQVTERGDDLSWLRIGGSEGLSKLPSLAASAATDSLKPLAVVLGRGGGSDEATAPVLTYQPYGTGRVVVVEGSGMWRWAFLPPEYREMDSAYGTLWQSLLRWLISSGGLLPGEDVALQMDRVSFTEGESVSAVVLRRPELDRDNLPPVELFDANGNLLQTVTPLPVGEELGVYQVFLGVLPTGHYESRLVVDERGESVTKSVHFDVRPDLREQLEVSARPDLMQRIAEISGGDIIDTGDPSSIGDAFEEHISKSRSIQYQRTTAWDRWWVLTGVLVLWTVTWGLRRRTGLV